MSLYANGSKFLTLGARMKSFFFCVTVLFWFGLNGQSLFYNNGAQFWVNPGAVMIVKTNTVENASGRIDNGGQIIIEEDFINAGVASGNGTNGVYDLYGDWINNGTFIPDQSEVNLLGGDQNIAGASVTTFHRLYLLGSGIKYLQINAEVNDRLDLTDRELYTGEFDMNIITPDVNSIQRTTGFVSSTGVGKLIRSTNSSFTYLFPTGSSAGTVRYRPVQITPAPSTPHVFGVRLANVDATSEGFDRGNKEEEICEINPLFYHRVYRLSGTEPADLSIFFDPDFDDDWLNITRYRDTPEWQTLNPSYPSSGVGIISMNHDDWVDNVTSNESVAYALSNPAPLITLEGDTSIELGSTAPITATISLPNSSYFWEPTDFLSCLDCLEPLSTPDRNITYYLYVEEGSVCEKVDSVVIEVFEIPKDKIDIPNAFTPNGDGNNDFVRLLGDVSDVNSVKFLVFNRWGEKLYEEDDLTTLQLRGWDGTYLGKEQEIGVYSYYLRVEFTSGINSLEKSGDITLIR